MRGDNDMQEIEKLIGRIEWIRRYNAGPFLEERNLYLAHVQKIGQLSRRTRGINRFLLEPVINFIPFESEKYLSAPWWLTMEVWGTKGKSAIQVM
jgi:hypothetical protein